MAEVGDLSYRGIFDRPTFYDRLCSTGAEVGAGFLLGEGIVGAEVAGAAVASSSAFSGIGAALASAAPWLSAASAGLSAVSALEQGQTAARQAQFQATIMEQQAAREKQLAEQAEDDYRRNQSRLMASRRAILGGSGVEPGEGSPLLTTEDMAGEIELQARRIRAGGVADSTRLMQQASLERARGKAERSGSYVRAGASLLSGAGMSFGRSTRLY